MRQLDAVETCRYGEVRLISPAVGLSPPNRIAIMSIGTGSSQRVTLTIKPSLRTARQAALRPDVTPAHFSGTACLSFEPILAPFFGATCPLGFCCMRPTLWRTIMRPKRLIPIRKILLYNKTTHNVQSHKRRQTERSKTLPQRKPIRRFADCFNKDLGHGPIDISSFCSSGWNDELGIANSNMKPSKVVDRQVVSRP